MLAPPPPGLLEGAALFLDFDGTLVELAETPDAIRVPPEGIRHPLLLIHARDDDRVSIDQSVEFAEELRDLGIPIEYEWLPFGGHTFGAPEQQVQVWERVEAFCRRAVGLPSH